MDPGDTVPLTPPSAVPLDDDDDTNLYDHFSTDFYDHFSTDLDNHFSTTLVTETTYESDDPFMGFVASPSPPADTFPDHD